MSAKEETIILTIDDFEDYFNPFEPERSLLAAIILNAISDLHSNKRDAAIAKNYLLDQSEDYIFSFRSICNHLDIDYRTVLAHAGLQSP